MKTEKLSLKGIKNALSRDEMKKVVAGCGCSGGQFSCTCNGTSYGCVSSVSECWNKC